MVRRGPRVTGGTPQVEASVDEDAWPELVDKLVLAEIRWKLATMKR